MSITRPLENVAEKLNKLRKELRQGGEGLLQSIRPLENARPLRNFLRRRKKRE